MTDRSTLGTRPDRASLTAPEVPVLPRWARLVRRRTLSLPL